MDDFRVQVEALSRASILLVACDYDGVLAPIVNDPMTAVPQPGALEALRSLIALPQTHVAIVSGRALSDLRILIGDLDGAYLIGCHGVEDGESPPPAADPEAARTLGAVEAEVRLIAEINRGFRVEAKPSGVAFHYREADPLLAAAMVGHIQAAARARQGLHLLDGKKVLEVSLFAPDKGAALKLLQKRMSATATLFAGDDVTDEDAFNVLTATDMGVRIGDGETRARHRLRDPAQFVQTLQELAGLRKIVFDSLDSTPIERHSVLSDQRTLAIVGPAARIVWMCLPRVDSPALFAELLGGPAAGYWSITPKDHLEPPEQSYSGDSMVLRTSWPGITVQDYLDCSGGRPFQRAGRTDLIRVIEGHGSVLIRFAPRPDFGRTRTRLRTVDGGLELEGTLDPIVLFSPGILWKLEQEHGHDTAIAEVNLRGSPVILELRYGSGSLRPALMPESQRSTQTARFWTSWASSLKLPAAAPEAVKRSALVLKSLTYGPSGAILAAGTTSLPETPGGVRNWDYRFCWPRDAAMSAAALLRLGNTGHAMRFLDWALSVLDHVGSPERFRPIYTVSGRELAPEAEITELPGYTLSRPVRINNAASTQVQLDVFGPVVEVAAMLASQGAPLSPEHWRLVEAMVAAVERRWREPDHGIWELRADRRHHVHSKVMCWLAVDRAITLSDAFLGRIRDEWKHLRSAIAEDVLASGWDAKREAFTTAYGVPDVDAGVLVIGLSGLLPPDDPRFASTVRAVELELRDGPVVLRYRYNDGLPGVEGGFHLCTGWLIESYILLGRLREARELFDQMLTLAGPTGIFAEQYCARRRAALGNIPQAYSHVAVINAAVALATHAPLPAPDQSPKTDGTFHLGST